MSNPYEAPRTDGAGPPPGAEVDRLRKIATYQRLINVAILAQVGAWVVLAILPMPEALAGVLRLVVLGAVGIGSLVAEVLLVDVLYSRLAAVLCAPVMLVPCVNLLTLLFINRQATARIRKAGFKVGLLGADPGSIR